LSFRNGQGCWKGRLSELVKCQKPKLAETDESEKRKGEREVAFRNFVCRTFEFDLLILDPCSAGFARGECDQLTIIGREQQSGCHGRIFGKWRHSSSLCCLRPRGPISVR
jgi:hypothetical protein